MTPVSQTTRHRGVGDHAAGTHDLGQIATGHDRRWLIIDATLEASGAPGLHRQLGGKSLQHGTVGNVQCWFGESIAQSLLND